MTYLSDAPSGRVTVPALSERKLRLGKRPILALTAYDFSFAKLLDRAGADLLLVGDSLASVIQGKQNTLEVTVDEIVYHSRLVARGAERALVVADMPFMSYQISDEQALENAARLIRDGGAAAVKLEGGVNVSSRIENITRYDIPVAGHIGLTPQSYHRMGGHKQQGRDKAGSRSAEALLEDALAVQEAGAFCCVLEGIPAALAKKITERLVIPTIGIGAGDHCDGQILVSYDMLGMNPEFRPKFLTLYENLAERVGEAVQGFRKDIDARSEKGKGLRVAK